jgi:nicotinate-nucleotide adenylyltransferase
MVREAVADHPAFAISRTDLDRPGPHYTVDMLALLQREYSVAEFFFLMGGDSLSQFPTWRDPEGIARLACLAVMPRPGWEADWEALERAVPGLRKRLVWIDAPHLGISASDLRRRVRQGLPLRYLIPPPVEAYIVQNCLYTGEVG